MQRMEFKIDTKDTFSTITPIVGEINAKLTGALREECVKMRQSGRNNFIIDLQHCESIDEAGMNDMVALHEESYSVECSLVYTGITVPVMKQLKESETDLLINVAPRMIEAIDIISMELLERDLFGEE